MTRRAAMKLFDCNLFGAYLSSPFFVFRVLDKGE
jgi:hypothetical protein